ncbi:ferrochelatase [Rickettsiella grylli]|uniref:Ferrochelatase n=1 Tax=Rickettsiella grylli TaxID=59196 RepID=A8PLQ1_9COXI|nr:ferrochelatase [Rickettsiella grylli]EDP45962.1 ferrochelatase [Rickettsiella grylli]
MKQGVLLVNLGTPSQPTTQAVRRYLSEFLSDRRVVEYPQWLWQIVLKLFILPKRARYLAKLYQTIWMDEGSPLAVITQRLTEKMQTYLGDNYQLIGVMRYGTPTIESGLKTLLAQGVTTITILPLYPQYSATTTASCFDQISQFFQTSRVIPHIKWITSYFDQRWYIKAIVSQIKKMRAKQSQPSYLLFSFHGLPQRYIENGDPYQQHCFSTVRLIAEQLQLTKDTYQVVFQSRFGKTAWLKPYCDRVLQTLPARGIKNVTIICPGFAVDCLETLEEISKRYRMLFLDAGGEQLTYIPALNDTACHVEGLSQLVRQAQ